MKRALVTGGAGFIGSHMCAALVEEGYQVTCLDNFSTGKKANVAGLKTVQVLEGDVNEWRFMKELLGSKFEIAFHYAAQVGVQRTEEAPMGVLNDVLGMRNLARLAKEGVVEKIVFASSSEVYGNPRRLPEKEQDGIIGWTPYTAVKLYGEHLFASLWQEHHIPTVSLRFFNVYGPRQIGTAYGFVVSIFINQALAGKNLTIFGDGRQTRDFVYVEDNVRMTLAAADCQQAWGEVINVGSGHEASILDLAVLINGVVGTKGQDALKFLPARNREVARRLASTKKMAELVGVKSEFSLAEGIKKTIEERQLNDLWSEEPLRIMAVGV
jgi:UDP-glucose 4-epimerase